jgi:hypothetical protein
MAARGDQRAAQRDLRAAPADRQAPRVDRSRAQEVRALALAWGPERLPDRALALVA